jgi:hypothetical protein
VSPNGGDTHAPSKMTGCLVLSSILLVFLIGVAVGFALGRGL